MSDYLTIEKLKFSGGVEIEDIANQHTYANSNTIGILKNNFDKLIDNTDNKFRLEKFSNNSDITPGISETIICTTDLMGSMLVIILFNKKSHLKAAIKASKTLLRHPKYLLDDDIERKKLLRQELLAEGFMHNSYIKETITGPYRAIKRLFKN